MYDSVIWKINKNNEIKNIENIKINIFRYFNIR
jgi:hypothetical protein